MVKPLRHYLRMRQQPKRHTTKQYMKEHIYAGFEARS